eukprot:1903827-Pleurochrysis_carterae.AAC.1
MCDGVGPKRRRCSARHQVGPSQLHNAPYGTFRDSVKLMNVWWAGGSVHAFIGKEFGELAREEFTSVIAVEGAHHS